MKDWRTGKQLSDTEITQAIYQFLLRCSSEHDPYDFMGRVVREIHTLIECDQARVLFIDISGKIAGSLLYGVSQQTWNNFMEYYREDLGGSIYSLKDPLHLSAQKKIGICDWTDPERIRSHEKFYYNYVKPLHLVHCLGIGFSDAENCLRGIISLDRTRDIPYSDEEIRLIRAIHPLLENYLIDLITPPANDFSMISFLGDQYNLTRREREITELMAGGLPARQISERLSLSIKTVYRHIANIYEKMHISSHQELFALIRKYDSR